MPINIDTLEFSPDDHLADLPPGVLTDFRRLAWMAFLAILVVEALVIAILFFVLPAERPPRAKGAQLKTMIVLGSGGRARCHRLRGAGAVG